MHRNLPNSYSEVVTPTAFICSNNSRPILDPQQQNLSTIYIPPYGMIRYAMFRDIWTNTQTWGGFSGVGLYSADHQHNDAGGFFIWRGDGYLTKGARNYLGNKYNIWNNLRINCNHSTNGGNVAFSGNPMPYGGMKPANLTRNRKNDRMRAQGVLR